MQVPVKGRLFSRGVTDRRPSWSVTPVKVATVITIPTVFDAIVRTTPATFRLKHLPIDGLGTTLLFSRARTAISSGVGKVTEVGGKEVLIALGGTVKPIGTGFTVKRPVLIEGGNF